MELVASSGERDGENKAPSLNFQLILLASTVPIESVPHGGCDAEGGNGYTIIQNHLLGSIVREVQGLGVSSEVAEGSR